MKRKSRGAGVSAELPEREEGLPQASTKAFRKRRPWPAPPAALPDRAGKGRRTLFSENARRDAIEKEEKRKDSGDFLEGEKVLCRNASNPRGGSKDVPAPNLL